MEIGESSYVFTLYAVPMWLTAAATLLLCVYVAAREVFSRVTVALIALHLTVAWWSGMTGWMYIAASEPLATTWARLAYVGVPLISPAMYTFVTLVMRAPPSRVLLGAIWALGGLFVVLSLATDLLIAGVQPHFWGYYFRYGPLGAPFLVFYFAVSLMALGVLWKGYRELAPGVERSRARLLLTCYGVGVLATVDFLAVYGFSIYPFGFAIVLAILVMKAQALSIYRLVDLTPAFAADQIVETMADPLLVVDRGGRIRVANGAAATTFGYTESELLGERLMALAGGADAAEALARLLDVPEARQHELLLRGRGGEAIEVSAAVSQLRDGAGSALGTVLILRDVRAAKEAERLLRNSEERFRSLIQSISDVILVVGADGEIAFGSGSLARVVGYLPEEGVGKNLFDFIHPDELAEIRSLFGQLVAAPGLTWTGEQRVRHRDGKWRTVEATATNLLHDPAVAGIVVSYHDITERKEAEAALRESQEKLLASQKMEAVGRLAGGIAHDFNNLLTVILGQARLALDQPTTDEEMHTALEEISRAGDRASELTRQLLAFSRKQMLQPRDLEVGRVVANLDRMLRRVLGAGVQLVTGSESEMPHIWADPAQVQQVVLNLAMNACDAMPDGGVLTIEARRAVVTSDSPLARKGTPPGEYVQIVVSDTGEGIAPDILPMIYEPFFTTKEVGKGTGLGLSTVYGIVEQSGGTIQVDSALGRGTTFRVFLPAAPLTADGEPSATDAASRMGETILLVEDSEPVRVLAGRMLRRRGFTVVEAENGYEALRIVADDESEIDMLVTDVVMPGMSGPDLVRRLRAARPDLPVLLISGFTDAASEGGSVVEDGTPFLNKPFAPEDLVRKVREVLDQEPPASVPETA